MYRPAWWLLQRAVRTDNTLCDGVFRRVGMRAISQRAVCIQKVARPSDDAITTDRVIVAASLRAAFLWDDICAI